jgi:hypothetical protein
MVGDDQNFTDALDVMTSVVQFALQDEGMFKVNEQK